jgi:hypothetical protein
VADELVQKGRLQKVRLLGDERFLAKDNGLGSCGVRKEQTPVNVATVAKIRVVRLLGGERESK